MSNRDEISASMKRAVRQRCGFGCVICGIPVYDYDHIEDHSKVKEHSESNLTLLCPIHHRTKTTGKVSLEYIIEANRKPHNLNKSMSGKAEELLFSGDHIRVNLAGNWFETILHAPSHRFDAIIINEQ